MAKHVSYLDELYERYTTDYLRMYNDYNPWMYSRKQKNIKGMFNKTFIKLRELERNKDKFWSLTAQERRNVTKSTILTNLKELNNG